MFLVSRVAARMANVSLKRECHSETSVLHIIAKLCLNFVNAAVLETKLRLDVCWLSDTEWVGLIVHTAYFFLRIVLLHFIFCNILKTLNYIRKYIYFDLTPIFNFYFILAQNKIDVLKKRASNRCGWYRFISKVRHKRAIESSLLRWNALRYLNEMAHFWISLSWKS